MDKKYNIAIVGATGLVGRTFCKLLFEFKIPINNLFLYASKKSIGKKIKINNKNYYIKEINLDDFKNIDYVLMSAGSEVSKKYGELFEQYGCIVIDNSSFFRLKKNIPLIVPEINYNQIKNRKRNIISNPNCSTIQSVICLNPIKRNYTIKKIIYNTYQAVSGSGMKGIFDYKKKKKEFYPFDIKKTCIPLIGDIEKNGFSNEENKMIKETKKILSLSNVEIIANCVRVPILNCHGVSIYVETKEEINLEVLKRNFQIDNSIIYYDKEIPNSIVINGTDKICVGRLRKCKKNSVIFFCFGDNIRKGAASNALQILYKMIYEN